MRQVANNKSGLSSTAEKILGERDVFSMENRLFNLLCFVSMIITVVFFIINALFGYWAISIVVGLVFLIEAVFYYFSRFRGIYRTNIIINGIVSYIALVASYYYDSGINGPIIFLFFFTFHLLVAATPNRLQRYWLAGHIITVGAIMAVEYSSPHIISYLYTSRGERLIDVLSCYIVTLVFIFIITRFLLNYYLRGKVKTQDSKFRLKAFFETSPSSYVLLNRQFEIIYFNHTAAKFVKQVYNKDLKNGMKILHLIRAEYQQSFAEHLNNALNGIPYQAERLFTYNDLGNIWWQMNFAPALNKKQKIIGVAVTFDNITERKEQEDNIKQRNRELMKIAYVQSHELRQPVSSILGLLNLLKEDGAYADEYLIYLDDAVAELDGRLHEILVRSKIIFKDE